VLIRWPAQKPLSHLSSPQTILLIGTSALAKLSLTQSLPKELAAGLPVLLESALTFD
jgi:hypothetical protein